MPRTLKTDKTGCGVARHSNEANRVCTGARTGHPSCSKPVGGGGHPHSRRPFPSKPGGGGGNYSSPGGGGHLIRDELAEPRVLPLEGEGAAVSSLVSDHAVLDHLGPLDELAGRGIGSWDGKPIMWEWHTGRGTRHGTRGAARECTAMDGDTRRAAASGNGFFGGTGEKAR